MRSSSQALLVELKRTLPWAVTITMMAAQVLLWLLTTEMVVLDLITTLLPTLLLTAAALARGSAPSSRASGMARTNSPMKVAVTSELSIIMRSYSRA
jgi:hypothetical protein